MTPLPSIGFVKKVIPAKRTRKLERYKERFAGFAETNGFKLE
jgi:hypothetical protein